MNNKMYNCRDKSTITPSPQKKQKNWKVILKQKVWSTKQLWRTKMVKVGYMWDVLKVVLNEGRTTTSHYSNLRNIRTVQN